MFAIGEAACVSVHGANRLGSNSLFYLVVFGRAATLKAKEKLKPNASHKKLHSDFTDWIVARLNKMRFAFFLNFSNTEH
ncbi:FAD-binding protein [Wolbachia endosymbiont of Atemnus politus]|uniref:FAD-binding protein n=1 Tax=Wolbachia endosymbiont of Atemnus politus TaxID=2682840 RepID=UPI0021048019|nr:FAD-binding protein [Wolbachia endosymbiont of Atemnus politus]